MLLLRKSPRPCRTGRQPASEGVRLTGTEACRRLVPGREAARPLNSKSVPGGTDWHKKNASQSAPADLLRQQDIEFEQANWLLRQPQNQQRHAGQQDDGHLVGSHAAVVNRVK